MPVSIIAAAKTIAPMNVVELWQANRLEIISSMSVIWGFLWGYIVRGQVEVVIASPGHRLTANRRRPGQTEGRYNVMRPFPLVRRKRP